MHKYGLENLFYKYSMFDSRAASSTGSNFRLFLDNHDVNNTQVLTLHCGLMNTSMRDFGLSMILM